MNFDRYSSSFVQPTLVQVDFDIVFFFSDAVGYPVGVDSLPNYTA